MMEPATCHCADKFSEGNSGTGCAVDLKILRGHNFRFRKRAHRITNSAHSTCLFIDIAAKTAAKSAIRVLKGKYVLHYRLHCQAEHSSNSSSLSDF